MPALAKLPEKILHKVTGWFEALVVMLPNALLALLVAVATVYVASWVQKLLEPALRRMSGNAQISRLLASVARIATLLVGGLFALSLLNLDKAVTSLLAGVGVVGFALGFAFQDIAANFVSGVIMAMNHPFEVGDLVEIDGHLGRILDVALRATAIETLDGLAITIPNKNVFQNAIINYTKTPLRRLSLKVGTAYGDDMQTVRRVVSEAVQHVPFRVPDRDVEVLFEEFGDSSINFSVLIWLDRSDQLSYRRARSEAMVAIKAALDREKLTIPFPIRTLDFGADAVGGTRLDDVKLKVAGR